LADREQRTENSGQRTADREQLTENGGQRTAGREQQAENRLQLLEILVEGGVIHICRGLGVATRIWIVD
jgi:hypothetical protein